jgi:hypothetical protein
LPVWTEALAGATVIFVRTGGAVTVMLAVPLTVPLEAVTVKGPPAAAPAVNSPDPLTVPPPLTDQVNGDCGLIGLPNWSKPVALNCADPPVATEVVAGETVIVVSTGVAVEQRRSASNPPEGYWASVTPPPVNPGPAQFAVAPAASAAPATQLGYALNVVVPPVMTPHW